MVQQRADKRELNHAFQEAAAFIRDFVELGKVGRVDHHDSAKAFRGCIAGGYDEKNRINRMQLRRLDIR